MAVDVANAGVTIKRKGGRTSRWAMKRNKIYTQKYATVSAKRSKENVSINEIIPLPATTTLEKENLSSSAIKGSMDLDPFAEDKEIMNVVAPSTYEKTAASKTLGSSEGRETLVDFHEEEIIIGNSMLCPSGEAKETEILGPFEGINIDGGMLCFNYDIMDNGPLDPKGDLTLMEERENYFTNFTEERESEKLSTNTASKNEAVDSVNPSTTGENGDVHSCSSITSYFNDSSFDWDWDWESVIQGHNDQQCDEKDNITSLLWESDNIDEINNNNLKTEDIDCEKENAMVAWLLS